MTGTRVELRDVRTQFHWVLEAPGSGKFAFTFVAPGTYQLFVEQIGFRPTRVLNVEVAPGVNTHVRVHLTAAAPPVTKIDTIVSGGALAGGSAGGPSVRRLAIGELPYRRLDLGEPAELSSQLDQDLGGDGLPARTTLLGVNGFPHDVARHPYLPGNLPGLPLSLSSLGRVDVISAPLDADWTDFSGTFINTTTQAGTRNLAGHLSGDWTGSPLTSSSVFDPGATSFQSGRAEASISGPIVPDTAVLIATVHGELDRQPRPPGWVTTAGNGVLASAATAAGSPVDALVRPRAVADDRIDGYSRLDWQLTSRHRAIVSGGVGVSRLSEPPVGPLGIPGPSERLVDRAAFADALVTSRFSGTLANEFRTGFEYSDRDYKDAGPAAVYITTGERFGTDPGLPADISRTGARLEDRLHVRVGSHQLKFGVAGSFATYGQRLSFGRRGIYWFDDADAFAAGDGAFLGLSEQAPAAAFTVTRLGFEFQDRWTILSGLDLYTAMRYDLEYLPGNEIPLNLDWGLLTGLDNRRIPGTVSDWSPRFGFVWRIGSSDWLLRGGVGLYRDLVDPAVFGELAQGGVAVQRGVGTLGRWPDAPAPTDLQDIGTRLSLLGPNYQTPRSAKATFGLARLLGSTGLISVELKYRHTDFLLRRHDLNRLPGPAAFDQYDRPLYASLVKEGSLLLAGSAGGRRFSGFEMVSALDPDGSSAYRGVTAEVQRSFGGMVRVRAAYTFSRTTDDWLSGLGGGPFAQLSPFPDSLNGRDWNDGRSDLDVPHRGTVGLMVRPFGARRPFSLDARYVIQSGRPFTPGFPVGVDANGDGSATNDPAFVDDKLPGMDAALGQWNCLGPQVGGFAQRNSCRDPFQQSLDVRLTVGPFVLGRVPVAVSIDALNLTDESLALRDHALLVVDRTAPLAVNGATGDVTVPLAVNPNFGQPLAYQAAGRSLRLSVRLGF